MKETHLKKDFDKKNFNSEASFVRLWSWYLCNLFFFRSGIIPFSNILVWMLRCFGAKIGKDVRIKPYVNIYYPWKLSLGDHSWLAECRIENLDYVTIGKNVCISQQAMLLTGNHDFTKQNFDLVTHPIIIEDGAWIAARTTVCPGVTIKSHAVLTVNSVATQDLEAYAIYKGNPAIKVKNRVIE